VKCELRKKNLLLTWLLWSLLSRFTPSQQEGKNVSDRSLRHAIGGRLLKFGESFSLKQTCWMACCEKSDALNVLKLIVSFETSALQKKCDES
jgi:hypothetical protein